MAGAMKPDALTVADDSHWKTWKFKDVISDTVEAENLQLRKKVEGFEEKYSHQERVHDVLKSELSAQKAHLTTLQKLIDTSNAYLRSRESELRNRENLLQDAHRKCEFLTERLQQYEAIDPSMYGNDSGKHHQSAHPLGSYSAFVDDLEAPSPTVAGRSKREIESPKRQTSGMLDHSTSILFVPSVDIH